MRIAGFLIFVASIAASADVPAETLALHDFMLIDGTGAAARPIDRMVIRDGVITDIGMSDAPSRETPETVDVEMNLKGAYVMPGLIDTHVHVGRFPQARVEAERMLRVAIQGGVTSVRDLGGDARALAEVQRSILSGEVDGPTLRYSAMMGGPAIFARPPIDGFSSGWRQGSAPWAQIITDQTDVPLAIASARGSGVRGIKLYGNVAPGLATRVIAEAKRQGLMAWPHATLFPTSPGQLVDAGVDSLSHAPYLIWEAVDTIPSDYMARVAGPWTTVAPDHPRLLALYRRMAEKGVLLDATLYIYKAMNDFSPTHQVDWADEAYAWAAKAVGLAHRAGVRITAGTDWFEPGENEQLPHTHDELELLVAAGLTPGDAIVAGTLHSAIATGLDAERGSIQPGKAADLLVLEANPLDDIRNTRRLRYVFKDGVVVRR